MASYLLQGDYEKVGMIRWLGGGNHEINWVYQNGTYYVFDLTAYSCLGNYSDRNVSVWEYADLADFYDAVPERFPKSEMTILVAFETDTASYPWGYEFDGVRQSLIFPEQTRGPGAGAASGEELRRGLPDACGGRSCGVLRLWAV